MLEMQGSELQVWTARPAEFAAVPAQDLDWLLDESERERAARFRHEADRRPYVLSHALRRRVLAQWLRVDPRDIVFSQEPDGRPVLAGPRGDMPYFSHSRSREAVAFAITRVAAVGIDVEPVRTDGADSELLSRFVALDDDARFSELATPERAARFYFYWTALEAFWKAQGRGLAQGNPRIRVRDNTRECPEVWLEGDPRGPHAQLFRLREYADVCITLALCSNADVRPQLCNGNMQLFNARATHEMLSPR